MRAADLLRFILPDVPGCPDETARIALMRSAAELCRRSQCWNEIQDAEDLVDGENEIQITPPAGALVAGIRDVWCGSRRLTPRDHRSLTQVLPDWQTATGSEPSDYVGKSGFGSILVYPIPAETSASIRVHAVYEPTLAATQLPDFLGQRYASALEHGAKSKLMLMSNQQWSNPTLGAALALLFEDAIATAAIDTLHSLVPGTIRVQSRQFGW